MDKAGEEIQELLEKLRTDVANFLKYASKEYEREEEGDKGGG